MPGTTRVSRKSDSIAAALAIHPDVVRMEGRPGQVLLYPHHLPTGLFLVLTGVVRRDGSRLLDANRGAFLVPPYDELDQPAVSQFTIARETAMLFIPRSVALHDGALRLLLEKAGFAAKSVS